MLMVAMCVLKCLFVCVRVCWRARAYECVRVWRWQFLDRGLKIGDEACRDLLASCNSVGKIGFTEFWEIVQSLQDMTRVSSVGRRGVAGVETKRK